MPAKAPQLTDQINNRLRAIGTDLRRRRKTLGLSAVVVAEAAGISRVTLHRIERGEPSVTIGAYLVVAEALGRTFEVAERDRMAGDTTKREGFVPVQISLQEYPILAGLAWQVSADASLTPVEALGIYERNWRHVDEGALSEHERVLIRNLHAAFGGELPDV